MSLPISYANGDPSQSACMAWRFGRDIQPLISLLKLGEADADAQMLAGDLLKQATQRKLAHKPRHYMRKAMILAQWALCRSMGTPSEQAKQAVAEMFGDITSDAVEKLISRNPDFVAQLRAELKFD